MRALKTLCLLLTLNLALPLSGASRDVSKRYAKLHKAEHWIVTETINDAAGCTATAVGPHALLTAEHCDMKDAQGVVLFFVDPMEKPDFLTSQTPYKIKAKIFDGSDHMILLLSGPAFKDVAPVQVSVPYQGEKVAWFGNPGGVRDMFREGYVMGVQSAPAPFQTKEQPLWTVAASAIPGDSGSFVFDEKTGDLVGIVTYGINGGEFMGMFVPHFTPAQLATAETYNGR